VGDYALSGKADADLEAIAAYSLEQWGLARAERSILALHRTFEMLAEFPDIGRDASGLRPGYRKMETASHSVFYRKTAQGVPIVRVLHQRMDHERHL
jgi:toxin ParE1/3/4